MVIFIRFDSIYTCVFITHTYTYVKYGLLFQIIVRTDRFISAHGLENTSKGGVEDIALEE